MKSYDTLVIGFDELEVWLEAFYGLSFSVKQVEAGRNLQFEVTVLSDVPTPENLVPHEDIENGG